MQRGDLAIQKDHQSPRTPNKSSRTSFPSRITNHESHPSHHHTITSSHDQESPPPVRPLLLRLLHLRRLLRQGVACLGWCHAVNLQMVVGGRGQEPLTVCRPS